MVREVLGAASSHPEALPGMIGGIQTFGELIHWPRPIHALVTEGAFLPDGTFVPLRKLGTEPFLKLREQAVFDLRLAEGKISEEIVANIRSWQRWGFSVDQSVRLEAEDAEGIKGLIEYFLRCPFSQARMIQVTDQRKEVGPLLGPECGATMKIIRLIEQHQSEVIEKILRDGACWEEEPACGPPAKEAVLA